MANEYVTDPDLLRQLNGGGGGEYITDPQLLAELNREPTTSHRAGVLSGIREAVLDAPAQLLERTVRSVAPGFADWLEEKAASTGLTAGKLSAQQATENARGSTANFFGADQPSAGGRIAGNIIGSALGPGAITGARVSGSLLPQALARHAGAFPKSVAAVEGALTVPLTQTVDDPNADFLTEKLKQTGAGGAGGAVGTAAARGLGRVLAPTVRPEVDLLMREGVTPSPGQVLGGRWQVTENKLTSVPVLGGQIEKSMRRGIEEMNASLYNRALSPIGERFSGAVPIGREGVREVRDRLGAAYDDVLERVAFKADDAYRLDTQRLRAAADADLPPELVKVFDKQLARVEQKLGPFGTMAGGTVKNLDSDLGKVARMYRQSQDSAQRALGIQLDELRFALRQNLARANPSEAARLSDIDSGYRVYVRIRDAAGRAGSHDGVITPVSLNQAVRSGATRTERAVGGATQQDIADAARDVLAQKVPSSGTTERLFTGGALGGGALGLAGLPAAAKAYAVAQLLSVPYRFPRQTAAVLTRRPERLRRAGQQVTARAPLAGLAGASLAGAGLRPDEEELLRAALSR